ncbi:MAG: fimbria major subunit [Bacteroides sp.]|nr:fimbria major subunit [Bacteroides sp.]
MKFKHLLFGSLFAAVMASCSNDLPGYDESGKVLENETTTFVRVSIMGEGGTRADSDYELGSPDESMVKSILLTFFDAGRNYVGRTLVDVNEDNTINVPGHENTVERMITLVAQVDLPENINYPKYVVAYVNPTSAAADLSTDKLEDAMRFVRTRNQVSHTGYRTMNNSMYFDENTSYSRFATEVDFNTNFFETMEEAKNASEATIEITVERMEAKVRLSKPLNEITSNPVESGSGVGDSKYKLEFVPEMWFVNGTEKRSFLLKNYRTTRLNYTANMSSSDFGYHLDALNNAFDRGANFTVNDESNKRSYWAIDPTYFYDVDGDPYPDVSFDVEYGTINPNATTYPLQYRSYQNVRDEYNNTGNARNNNYVKFNGNAKAHEYVLENTMSFNTLRSTDAKAAMTSVVILGHYVIRDQSNAIVFNGNENNTAKSFYLRHEANGDKYVMINDSEAIDFFMERQGSTFFVQSRDASGKVIDGEFEAIRAAHLDPNSPNNANHVDYGIRHDDFSIEYPGTDVTGGKKQSEQWRTLRVKKSTNGTYNDNLYVYDYDMNDGAGGYKKLNDLSDAEIQQLLARMYSSFGVLEKFQAGKAYFNVPLKHIWGELGSNSNEFKPDVVKLGDYGVVRNHVYDLTVNTISGIGTGIGDIRQPIIPPTENEQYYISTRLNILKWRVVKQSVDL